MINDPEQEQSFSPSPENAELVEAYMEFFRLVLKEFLKWPEGRIADFQGKWRDYIRSCGQDVSMFFHEPANWFVAEEILRAAIKDDLSTPRANALASSIGLALLDLEDAFLDLRMRKLKEAKSRVRSVLRELGGDLPVD